MHNYINKRLNDFLSISRKEMDSIFYKLERSIDHLLEELIEEEYIKEVKRFEKI